MKSSSHYRRYVNAAASLSKETWKGFRLACKLPFFFRHPVTFEEAKAAVKDRLERRQESFLTITRKSIYPYPENPYRKLFRFVGCEYGDLEKLVSKDGVEGALKALFRAGVYFTVDEFKGRAPVVRGSLKMEVHPGLFRNSFSQPDFTTQTSGSRGARTVSAIDLERLRQGALTCFPTFEALEGHKWVTSTWMGPGGADFPIVIRLSCIGSPPARWFLRGSDPAAKGNRAWRWKTRMMRWGSSLAGIRIPSPAFVPHDDPLPIVNWMAEVINAGGIPFFLGFSSSAVHICQAAQEAGIDIGGTQFMIGGEPITEARLEAIHREGAKAIPLYTSIETGFVGQGCLSPEAPDDVHLLNDLNALIQPDEDVQDMPSGALFITSLLLESSFLLLNVSMGDMAVIQERECGCPLQDFGWNTHLHTIRSYEKLTTAGLTMLDTDVIRVLEEVLPAHFGGGPTDYQLVEDESQGQPHLTLLVNPGIAPVGADKIAEAFLEGIGARGSRLWQTPGFFRVDRRMPIATASGKILHLHANRRTTA